MSAPISISHGRGVQLCVEPHPDVQAEQNRDDELEAEPHETGIGLPSSMKPILFLSPRAWASRSSRFFAMFRSSCTDRLRGGRDRVRHLASKVSCL